MKTLAHGALVVAALMVLAHGDALAQAPPVKSTPAAAPVVPATWFEAARQGDLAALRRALPAASKPSRGKAPSAAGPIDAADASGYTALILAAYHDHREVVRWLLARGANTCAADRRGFTALMGATFRGHAKVVDLLTTRPCGADHVTASGQTPLMLAALFGRTEIARALLAAGADPSRQDGLGNQARSLAEGQGNAEMIKLLDEHRRPDATSPSPR